MSRRVESQRDQFAYRIAAEHCPHQDLADSHRAHGTVHTTGGRILPGWKLAVADTATQQSRLADPTGWSHHVAVTPSGLAVAGARAYASLKGLDDPHDTDYSRIMQSPERVARVGRHYDAMPDHDPAALPHYQSMLKEVGDQYDFMTNRLGIKVQPVDYDPYAHVGEMMADVNNNKTLKVLGTHVTGGHPVFGNEGNDKFRAVHDFFGHAATGRDFDRHGEHATYLAHARMFSPHAVPALTNETLGQNSSLILNGHFGPQKIGVIPRHVTATRLAMPTYTAAEAFDRGMFSDGPGEGQSVKGRGPWYHVSPHDLPVGTVLTPGGGQSMWDEVPHEQGGNQGAPKTTHGPKISDYVWIDGDREASDFRLDHYRQMSPDGQAHQYEVDTDHEPEDYNGEYAVPQATIKRRVSRRIAMPWRIEHPDYQPADVAHDYDPDVGSVRGGGDSRNYLIGPANNVWWHGSASGDVGGGDRDIGLHVGDYQTAAETLDNILGPNPLHPAGRWIGQHSLSEAYPGHYDEKGNSLKNHLFTHPDGTPMHGSYRPNVFPVAIVGPMANTTDTAVSDGQAHAMMQRQYLQLPKTQKGYYYINAGEGLGQSPETGIVYSVSATVPSASHFEKLDPKKYKHIAEEASNWETYDPPNFSDEEREEQERGVREWRNRHTASRLTADGRAWSQKVGTQTPPQGLHFEVDTDDYDHPFGWAITEPVGYRTPRWTQDDRPVLPGGAVEPYSRQPKRYFSPYEKNPPPNTYARPDPGAYFSPTEQPVLPGMMNDADSEYGSDRDPLTLHRGFKLWLHDDGEHLAKIRRLLYGPEHEDDEAMWFNPHGGLSGQGGYDFMLPGMPANQEATAPLASFSRRFDHPDLPHHIFNHLLDRESKGLGTHWTTKFDTAAGFAGLHPYKGDAPIGSLPVVISGNWMGLGEDPYRHYTEGDFSDEHEITLIPGAPITPRGIHLHDPETGRWHTHTLSPQQREARVLGR